MWRAESKSRGNALMITLIVISILIPIGFTMMYRMRTQTFENKRVYDSIVLISAAKAGVELILDNIRQGNMGVGPYSQFTVPDMVKFDAYLQVTGIGLVGQKTGAIFSKGISVATGDEITLVLSVEIYPLNATDYMPLTHSYYTQYQATKDLKEFQNRQELLNKRDAYYAEYQTNLQNEAAIIPTIYTARLESLESKVPTTTIQSRWSTIIVPELVRTKPTP